ncbi:hypothetical protein HNP40_003937 [Mycobacteroides chelonae]|nr:hypothetical protein [Mycobacteroides chelonae]
MHKITWPHRSPTRGWAKRKAYRDSHNHTQHADEDIKYGYQHCYGWREDAESLNNTLDGGCMTAHSRTRQHAVMIGFALGRNAIAHYLHRSRQKNTTA